jgi:hypothetical protein
MWLLLSCHCLGLAGSLRKIQHPSSDASSRRRPVLFEWQSADARQDCSMEHIFPTMLHSKDYHVGGCVETRRRRTENDCAGLERMDKTRKRRRL